MITIIIIIVICIVWHVAYNTGKLMQKDEDDEEIYWLNYRQEERIRKLEREKREIETGMESEVQRRVEDYLRGFKYIQQLNIEDGKTNIEVK